jgi:hypothetical protein
MYCNKQRISHVCICGFCRHLGIRHIRQMNQRFADVGISSYGEYWERMRRLGPEAESRAAREFGHVIEDMLFNGDDDEDDDEDDDSAAFLETSDLDDNRGLRQVERAVDRRDVGRRGNRVGFGHVVLWGRGVREDNSERKDWNSKRRRHYVQTLRVLMSQQRGMQIIMLVDFLTRCQQRSVLD